MELVKKCLIKYNNKRTNQITKKEVDDDELLRFTLLDMQNFAKEYHTEQLRLGAVVGRSEQLVCPDCKIPFTKEELEVKEHCFNCGWEFAN